jgi:hypothetical protein
MHKRLREFEEIEISRQSCKSDCECKEEEFSGFRPRIRPQVKVTKRKLGGLISLPTASILKCV